MSRKVIRKIVMNSHTTPFPTRGGGVIRSDGTKGSRPGRVAGSPTSTVNMHSLCGQ